MQCDRSRLTVEPTPFPWNYSCEQVINKQVKLGYCPTQEKGADNYVEEGRDPRGYACVIVPRNTILTHMQCASYLCFLLFDNEAKSSTIICCMCGGYINPDIEKHLQCDKDWPGETPKSVETRNPASV